MPTSGKWAEEQCQGVQGQFKDIRAPMFAVALQLCSDIMKMGSQSFEWKKPPYEYNYETRPMKLILGTEKLMQSLESHQLDFKASYWFEGHEEYLERVQDLVLYHRKLKSVPAPL